MSDQTKLISIKKAANLLGVTPLTLRNWDKSGKLKALRHPMNNYRVYRRDDIETLLSTMSTEPHPLPKPAKKGLRKLEIKHEE